MTNYNIEIRQFNGTDYDVLYPVTTIGNILDLENQLNNRPILTTTQVTLTTSGWSGNGSTTPYTQDITIAGVTTSSNIIINIVPVSTSYTGIANEVNNFQYINFTTPLNGKVRFTCVGSKPTVALTVKVLCFQ